MRATIDDAPAVRTRGMPWTPDELDEVRARYRHEPAAAIGARLGRSAEAVRQRAASLGLATPVSARIRWTPERDALLRAGYRRGQVEALAWRIGTTPAACQKRAQEIGVARRVPHRPWTRETEATLVELYGLMPTEQIADRLGYSRSGIYNRLKSLGVTRESAHAARYARDQGELRRLRALVGSGDGEAGPTVRRLRVLLAYRMGVLTEAEAAVAAGIPPGRLIVECGREAARGQAEAGRALEEDRA